jgi:hypothetical protein
MEAIEKLDTIVQEMINEKKKEIDRSMKAGIHPAYPYI